ncbi:DNA-binding bromodomain-containing protein [Striga asiatica]|uniref:DNA-binding bromodomain-containing protein n=1 Tax=Striga asiatica TaxID=4170 RepID=A0A5A7R6K8_STRAF|nr:DNA-binding bromodomain-containing protein [Striga asiatica]
MTLVNNPGPIRTLVNTIQQYKHRGISSNTFYNDPPLLASLGELLFPVATAAPILLTPLTNFFFFFVFLSTAPAPTSTLLLLVLPATAPPASPPLAAPIPLSLATLSKSSPNFLTGPLFAGGTSTSSSSSSSINPTTLRRLRATGGGGGDGDGEFLTLEVPPFLPDLTAGESPADFLEICSRWVRSLSTLPSIRPWRRWRLKLRPPMDQWASIAQDMSGSRTRGGGSTRSGFNLTSV